MIGGVIGVAIFGMVIKNKFSSNYRKAYPNIPNASVNDIKILENAPHHYVKAVNFSYIATFVPPAMIMFLLSFFLTKLKFISKNKNSNENLIQDSLKDEN